jgi:hypothetical protein
MLMDVTLRLGLKPFSVNEVQSAYQKHSTQKHCATDKLTISGKSVGLPGTVAHAIEANGDYTISEKVCQEILLHVSTIL